MQTKGDDGLAQIEKTLNDAQCFDDIDYATIEKAAKNAGMGVFCNKPYGLPYDNEVCISLVAYVGSEAGQKLTAQLQTLELQEILKPWDDRIDIYLIQPVVRGDDKTEVLERYVYSPETCTIIKLIDAKFDDPSDIASAWYILGRGLDPLKKDS